MKRLESARLTPDEEQELLPIGRAAGFLGVSRDTIRRWEKRGLLSSFRVGPRRDRRYAMRDLEALIE